MYTAIVFGKVLFGSTSMSKKDHAKRVARERKKHEQRKQEHERSRQSMRTSPGKVLRDLKSLFKDDAARAMILLCARGLPVEEIAVRCNVAIERVRELGDKVNGLPPSLKKLLEANPEVLLNSNVLQAGLEGVRERGL